MDAMDTRDDVRLLAEETRHDRGVVFLVGMAVAGFFAVFASLAFVDSPAAPGSAQAQVSTR